MLEWYAPVPLGSRPSAATPLFAGGLDLDSVALVQLVLELETEFGCQIPSELVTAETFRTVGDVVDLVGAKVGSNA